MAPCYEPLLTLLRESRFKDAEGNVFLIGPTKIGKTTIAWELCFETPDVYLNPVQASKWIKEQFKATDFPSYEEYVTHLTSKSQELLMGDPDLAIRRIMENFNPYGGGCMIEGIRNPRDFVTLFDFRKDLVVFLENDAMKPINEFEQGIVLIKQYVDWLKVNFKGQVFSMEVKL